MYAYRWRERERKHPLLESRKMGIAKQDAIPGMQIPIYFTPTMTSKDFLQMLKGTAREGQGYEIACAQLCGNSHYRMKGYVTIETEQEFNEWLAEEAEYLEEEGDDDWDDDW